MSMSRRGSVVLILPSARLRRLAALALLWLTIGTSACSSPSTGVTLAGSTSLQPFVEMLAEEYSGAHPETTVNVQGGGSSAGIEAAISGAAQIGMSSRDLKGDELKLFRTEIARDAIAIVVHPNNPVANLSTSDVKRIFSGQLKRWGEVGGRNAAIVVVTREEGSGTRGAFQDLVLGKDLEVDSGALVQDSNGAVRQLVASDPNSIGYISLGLVNSQVRAVQLDGVTAADSEVAAGRYTLVRPFLFVTREQPTGASADFISFVLSAKGQQELANEGLLPPGGAK
jgi:phosphate transport system substrate-binding protein